MNSRYKRGMINLAAADRWALDVVAARDSLRDDILSANAVPAEWPVKETFFNVTTYTRGSTSPTGGTGDAPTVETDGALADWRDTQGAYAGRWAGIYGDLVARGAMRFGGVNWFVEFGRHGGPFDRNLWRAGSVDMKRLVELDALLPDVSGTLSDLQELLTADQLEDEDFVSNYLRDWESTVGTQHTLELSLTNTEDILPGVATRLPVTLGGGQALLWDACKVEVAAKASAALALIDSLVPVADLVAETRACIEYFNRGSQTASRDK